MLLYMNAMAPYVSFVMSSVQHMLLFPSETQDFSVCVDMRNESRNTKYKEIRSLASLRSP